MKFFFILYYQPMVCYRRYDFLFIGSRISVFMSAHKEKREWKRDLLPNEEEIVTSVTSHGWLKEKIRWCGQALLGSFLFIISQVLPTVTNDFLFHFLFKRRAIEPQLVIWRWIALRKGNESLAGTKKKEKMNQDRSSVPTFIKEKIMWARSIIHFSSSFMCRLARLMIGTVKKRLSLDPASAEARL